MDKAPSNEEIMTYDVVPVKIAAKYLGMSQQTVRNGMRKGYLKIGVVIGSHFYIYPAKLIAVKEGEEVAERLGAEIKTVAALMGSGTVKFDDILKLVGGTP